MLIRGLRFPSTSLYLSNCSALVFSSLSHMSNQKLIPPTPEGIAHGASLIREGKLVAFPTETVYGLGANALDAQACTSIFRAKGRPMTDPLIVHVAEPSMADPLVAIEGPTRQMFEKLAAEFWPGPLTIIVKAATCIPAEVTANTGFVGIRCPNHPLALTFLSACQRPVAAPSANLFGHVSPTLAQHVLDDLGERGVCVLDGDSTHGVYTCLHGIESTVVKLDNTHATSDMTEYQITILRQGAVSQAQLQHVAKSVTVSAEESQGVGEWSVQALQRQVVMEAPPVLVTTTDTGNNSSADNKVSTCSLEEVATGTDTHDVSPTTRGHGLEQSSGEVAPGQSLTHYAPYIPCYAVASCVSNISTIADFNTIENHSQPQLSSSLQISVALEKYVQQTIHLTVDTLRSIVILDFLGQLSHYSAHCLAYRDLSASGDATAAARSLFAALRWAELQPHATRVLMAPIISSSVGVSVNDNTDKEYTTTSTNSTNGSTIFNEDKFLHKNNFKNKNNSIHYDLFFGLSDRIFRATSGASVQVVIE